MIEVQHILDKQAVLAERRDEEFVDPFTTALAHCDRLAWRRSLLSCYAHTSGG
jgi:hypothetical protein